MSPKQADRLIGKTIKLTDKYGDCAEVTIAYRDRWHVYTTSGAKIDRTDIQYWEQSE
jgi:hypothetical protein